MSAQMEDYLEAILQAAGEHGVARVKDVAARLRVTGASVVGALRALKARGLVRQERYSFIRLTPRGEELARAVRQRHVVLAGFLEDVLGLDPATADDDACRIEHAASAETVRRLGAAAELIARGERGGLGWAREFSRYRRRTARRREGRS